MRGQAEPLYSGHGVPGASGNEQVEQWHRVLAWALLGLVALHVASVLHASWRHASLRHRMNLLRAMLSSTKNAAANDGVARAIASQAKRVHSVREPSECAQ